MYWPSRNVSANEALHPHQVKQENELHEPAVKLPMKKEGCRRPPQKLGRRSLERAGWQEENKEEKHAKKEIRLPNPRAVAEWSARSCEAAERSHKPAIVFQRRKQLTQGFCLFAIDYCSTGQNRIVIHQLAETG